MSLAIDIGSFVKVKDTGEVKRVSGFVVYGTDAKHGKRLVYLDGERQPVPERGLRLLHVPERGRT